MRKPTVQALLGVILPVLAGTCLYLLFRPHGILIFSWLDYTGVGFLPAGEGVLASLMGNPFTDWLVFSLPDGLWIFAFANAILLIWTDAKKLWRFLIICALGVFYIAYEAGQALGVIGGTFDLLDIITCLVALAASMVSNMGKGDCYHAREVKDS